MIALVGKMLKAIRRGCSPVSKQVVTAKLKTDFLPSGIKLTWRVRATCFMGREYVTLK